MAVLDQTNSVILEGNMTREAVYREPKPGFKVARFPIAVSRVYKRKSDRQLVEEVSYFDIEAHGNLADKCKDSAVKGCRVRTFGHIKQDRWEDKDGKRHSKVFIIAEHIEFDASRDRRASMEDAIKAHNDMIIASLSSNPIAIGVYPAPHREIATVQEDCTF